MRTFFVKSSLLFCQFCLLKIFLSSSTIFRQINLLYFTFSIFSHCVTDFTFILSGRTKNFVKSTYFCNVHHFHFTSWNRIFGSSSLYASFVFPFFQKDFSSRQVNYLVLLQFSFQSNYLEILKIVSLKKYVQWSFSKKLRSLQVIVDTFVSFSRSKTIP